TPGRKRCARFPVSSTSSKLPGWDTSCCRSTHLRRAMPSLLSYRIEIRRSIRRWAATVDRPLPWRGERDPYKVLVSEVMLQQTQASRVVEPYLRFLERFPSVASLAAADAADVLREWGTLGYNRRALNLWRAARAIVERGGFPRKIEELQELTGVGPYNARAVASFAFIVDCRIDATNHLHLHFP